MKIEMTDKEILNLEMRLEFLNEKGIPFAVRNALNKTAFGARRIARRKISKEFIERNQFTRNRVLVERASGNRISLMESRTGHTEDYMRVQEEGGVKRSEGKHGVPIPTSFAAGQGEQNPRTQVVMSKNRLGRIRLRKRPKGKTRKQRLIATINVAVREGLRYVYLDSVRSKRKGIYRIVGGRYMGRGWPDGAKIKMVYDLTQKVARIESTEWLEPSSQKAAKRMRFHYQKALLFQLDRLRR